MNGLVAYMLVALIAPTALPTGGAAALEQRFGQAQAQFEAAQARLAATSDNPLEARRMFREAAERFAAIATDGTASANLYVNTGNAYHFAGDEPRALLWYLRASGLASTQDIRAGLATLRRVCKVELWAPSRPSIWRVLMSWHYDLGRWPKQAVMLTLCPIGCVLVIGTLLRRASKRWLRIGLVLLAIGSLMGASDAVAVLAGGEQWAVILSQAKGYAGDGQMYSVLVDSIAPGQEVRIVEVRRDWMQIELPSGARCWVSRDVCESISPRL